jgi:hypothetical protein
MYFRGKEAVSFEYCQLICPCLGKGFSPPYSRKLLPFFISPVKTWINLIASWSRFQDSKPRVDCLSTSRLRIRSLSILRQTCRSSKPYWMQHNTVNMSNSRLESSGNELPRSMKHSLLRHLQRTALQPWSLGSTSQVKESCQVRDQRDKRESLT